jgi:DNA-binding LacI/PurR family transcriptional regulator
MPEAASRQATGRATLDSVARLAGVSRQTVSNVLNSPQIVRPETAERVSAAIATLGYRPHRAAQQLRTRRSRVFGLRAEKAWGDKVFDRFMHALTDAAADRDHRIMLYTADGDDTEIAACEELWDRWDVDAMVLAATHPGDRRTAHLTGRGIPCVTFGRPWDDSDHHSWVDVDGAAGTAAATELLIAAGHTRIGFLGWPDGSGVGDDRLAGWQSTVRRAGLPVLAPVRSANEIAGGRFAAAELLDRSTPTAVVCCSDVLGIGVLAELAARGLQPGGDVAVVGFDDTDLAQVTGLSSIAQPLPQVAAHVVRLLIAEIETGPPDSPARVLLTPEPVLRASTGPLRRNRS